MTRSRPGQVPAATGIVVVVMGLLLAGLIVGGAFLLRDVKDLYQALLPLTIREYLWVGRTILFDPHMWLFAGVIFVLERAFPAKPDQRIFSTGLALDFCWYVLFALNVAFVMPLYAGTMRSVYDRHFSFLTLTSLDLWPTPYRIILSLLLIDFTHWLRHYVQHKVAVLWYFHAVHHAQHELNLFSDLRMHFVESFYDFTALFVPMFILGATAPTDLYLAAVLRWYGKINHSNLRTNYGVFGYFVVSPQYHRIHHSIEPTHVDKNFGFYFTIWDRIFGTMHENIDEYPETGINDARFPILRSNVYGELFPALVAQFIYPFRQMVERFSAKADRSEAHV